MDSLPWITWYNGMENSQLMELCRKCHIGLLPTLADTYGYSVLEMQANGLPVITTDIRALPEINNDEIGWLCHIAKDNIGGEAFLETRQDRDARRSELTAELRRVFAEVFAGGFPVIRDKGLKALQRIEREHNPEAYGEFLRKIYTGTFGSENPPAD